VFVQNHSEVFCNTDVERRLVRYLVRGLILEGCGNWRMRMRAALTGGSLA
jgi:hypothetical protein